VVDAVWQALRKRPPGRAAWHAGRGPRHPAWRHL